MRKLMSSYFLMRCWSHRWGQTVKFTRCKLEICFSVVGKSLMKSSQKSIHLAGLA
jgi:hypothetical protein